MKNITVNIGNIKISNKLPFVLFGGMNVLEKYDTIMQVCEYYVSITQKLNIPYIFKASFDKANRTSIHSYRGPGLESGLRLFQMLKKKFGVKLMTDVHEINQAQIISEVVDVIQLPAFLARQTDLIKAIAQTGSVVNIKKPQYMSPEQVQYIVNKFHFFKNNKIILCERGTMFGYNDLIVDILGLHKMQHVSKGCPIIVDVTHALQTRQPYSAVSEGKNRLQIFDLAKASIAVGIAGLFIEAHPDPDNAKCDGPIALPLYQLPCFLNKIKLLDTLVKSF